MVSSHTKEATSPNLTSSSFTPREYSQLSTDSTLASLPPVSNEDTLLKIRTQITASTTTTPLLIALDDDPTGTQTCHDIAVLTVWDHETLCKELSTAVGGFFILTSMYLQPLFNMSQPSFKPVPAINFHKIP